MSPELRRFNLQIDIPFVHLPVTRTSIPQLNVDSPSQSIMEKLFLLMDFGNKFLPMCVRAAI